MSSRQSLGRWGEEVAARYLQGLGFTILARNFRTPYGEIDLIACRDQAQGDQEKSGQPVALIVFVEVKTRATPSLGLPEISVTTRKQAHLRAAIEFYMLQNPDLEADWRLDVIAIQRYDPGQPPTITHFENAFS